MSFQEGKKIHLELRNLIQSKLKIIDKPPKKISGKAIRFINYDKQLKSLPAIGQYVEEYSLRLVELYYENPVLGQYLVDLFQLTDHCIKVVYQTHKPKSDLAVLIKSKKAVNINLLLYAIIIWSFIGVFFSTTLLKQK